MLPVMSALLAFVTGLFRSRASLCLEHLALRHQLAVYQQTVARPRLRSTDRMFWGWLSWFWRGWPKAVVFVQPRTVIAWQQQRFRHHWRRLCRLIAGQHGQWARGGMTASGHDAYAAVGRVASSCQVSNLRCIS
jgi:putative transposase